MAEEALVFEALRRGLISEDEARRQLAINPMEHTPVREGGLPSGQSFGERSSTLGEMALRGAGSVGRGVIDAGKNLAALPIDVFAGLDEVSAGGPFASSDAPFAMKGLSGREIMDRGEKALPFKIFEPDTPETKAISKVAQGAASMAMPGANASLIGLGAASGGAGAAAAQYRPQNPALEPLAEIVTLLLGAPALRSPRTVRVIKDIVDEIGVEKLGQMKAAQGASSVTLGKPTLASHFAPENTGLTALVRELQGSAQGRPLRDAMRGETEAMEAGQRRMLRQNSDKAAYPQEDANAVAAAIDKAMQRPYRELRDKARPFYEAAKTESIPPEALTQLVAKIKGIPQELGTAPTSDAAKAVQMQLKRLEGAIGKPTVVPPEVSSVLDEAGRPIVLKPGTTTPPKPVSGAELDSLKKGAASRADDAALKNAKASVKERAVANTKVAEAIRETATKNSPSIEAATEIYTKGMEALIPHKTGPLAGILSKKAVKEHRGSFESSMDFLRKDTTTAADVRAVGEAIRKESPEALRDMIGQNVWHAAETTKSPAEFAAALIGDSNNAMQKGAVLKESVRQNALAAGRTPEEAAAAAEGAYRFLDTVRSVSAGQAAVKGSVESGVAEKAGKNVASMALRLFNPIGLYIRAWAEAGPLETSLRKKMFKTLAETLSTPAGIDRLIEISKYDQAEHVSRILARGIVGIEGQTD